MKRMLFKYLRVLIDVDYRLRMPGFTPGKVGREQQGVMQPQRGGDGVVRSARPQRRCATAAIRLQCGRTIRVVGQALRRQGSNPTQVMPTARAGT